MSIKRYTADKDNTITDSFGSSGGTRATGSNCGASDVMEMFSIYSGMFQGSIEKARSLIEFPISQISSDRDSEKIPASGSVNFKLKLFNAPHGETAPRNYYAHVCPVLESWSEGTGTDMIDFIHKGASNWISASTGQPWVSSGGSIPSASLMANETGPVLPVEYSKFFDSGTEDLEVDITSLVEEWLKHYKSTSVYATASLTFNNSSTAGQKITLTKTNGDFTIFEYTAGEASVSGKTVFVPAGNNATNSAINFYARVVADTNFTAHRRGDVVHVVQPTPGFYGNTIISSTANNVAIVNFRNGTGVVNNGVLVKLSGSYEDGSEQRSYYTKKFYTRSSQNALLRPVIEAQYDLAIKDDRGDIMKSSSLAPASDNLNTIYLYNKVRGSMKDIPSPGGGNFYVQLVPSEGSNPVGLVGVGNDANFNTFITASKHSTGIYKAQFAYSGSETTLRDVWQHSTDGSTYTQLHTGSAFSVRGYDPGASRETPSYVTSITNLKDSYRWDEEVRFRIYTRDKNWNPNAYTVASKDAPVSTIRQAYYKITRKADNLEVIQYSTGSSPSYSSLSYDASGSYFDLDMSILEPNYLYEISILYKDDSKYVEQKEKFKFRIDP
mgnify:CR=1 FL=1|tara:strand:+ start:20679 stop:22508 length:1830 start_codon:yes stop_codon:yes gene_type:complete